MLLALFLPRVYVSKSTILIEQKLSPEYVKTASPGSVEDRLQAIRQQILSREKLLEIIEKFKLYPSFRDQSDKEEIVKKMQEDISLKTISADEITGRSRGRLDTVAFTLSYEANDALTAQKVAGILASLFLEKNLQERELRATKTEAVLQQTVEQMKEQTEAYGKKLSAFKVAHEGELPESKEFNNQQVSRLTTNLDQIDASLRILQDRRVFLQGQLASIDPGASAGADASSANPRIRLQRLRKELVVLRTKYSEKHPDVIRTKRQIAELEEKAAESAPQSTPDNDFDNPAYANLRTQLASTESEIKALNEQKVETRRRIEGYLRTNERASGIEPEYKKLLQDYESAQKKYTELSNKLMEATVTKGVEETQQIERFTIIEQAQVPDKPEKPNRGVILAVGFLLSAALGIFASIVRENFDHSVKSAEELQNLTRVPVLSILPYILNEEEELKKIQSDRNWEKMNRYTVRLGNVLSGMQARLKGWRA